MSVNSFDVERDFRQKYFDRKHVLGDGNSETLDAWSKWTNSLRSIYRPYECMEELALLLKTKKRVLGAGHHSTLQTWDDYKSVLRFLKRPIPDDF
jgi:hypothetical protein